MKSDSYPKSESKGVKLLQDTQLPPDNAPMAGKGSGDTGLGGGIKGAVEHLNQTVKNQAKMHECMGTPNMAGSPK
jgi:hypothetical protein